MAYWNNSTWVLLSLSSNGFSFSAILTLAPHRPHPPLSPEIDFFDVSDDLERKIKIVQNEKDLVIFFTSGFSRRT